jgi:hypothetical protein
MASPTRRVDQDPPPLTHRLTERAAHRARAEARRMREVARNPRRWFRWLGRLPLVASFALLTAVAVLGLGTTGLPLFLYVFLLGTFLLVGLQVRQTLFGEATTPEPPAPAAPAAPPEAEPPRLDATAPRSDREIGYQATRDELERLTGVEVVVDASTTGERRPPVITRLRGRLQPGPTDVEEDEDDGHWAHARGQFFSVGESGSGFFLPIVDYVGAEKHPRQLRIVLRTSVVSVSRLEPPETRR